MRIEIVELCVVILLMVTTLSQVLYRYIKSLLVLKVTPQILKEVIRDAME